MIGKIIKSRKYLVNFSIIFICNLMFREQKFSGAHLEHSRLEPSQNMFQMPQPQTQKNVNLQSLSQALQTAFLPSSSQEQIYSKRSLAELIDVHQINEQNNKFQRTEFNKQGNIFFEKQNQPSTLQNYSHDFEFKSQARETNAQKSDQNQNQNSGQNLLFQDVFGQNELTALFQKRIFNAFNLSAQNEDCSTDYRSSSSTEDPRQTVTQQNQRKKSRMVWSHQLHEKFVKSVAELGGAWSSTPTSILKCMNVPHLTLGHIKSHLQKYRHKQQLVQNDLNAKVKVEINDA
eukprot:TRINITY_DN8279_c0_g3_i7.p2 TRINITY_DN8279_c0_g3~~TRINITY_DN8279_c0_g3_i7.p2  ORF type:complete len:289 (-),score=31.62 TRINITY_DN8279_c0_g3_i7:301-1167(-)